MQKRPKVKLSEQRISVDSMPGSEVSGRLGKSPCVKIAEKIVKLKYLHRSHIRAC